MMTRKTNNTTGKINFISIVTALFFLMSFSGASFAEGDAIKTMAKIMFKLDRSASVSEKNILKGIAKDGDDEHDKTLAEAIFNINNKVNTVDISKLKFVLNDHDSSQEEKDLANIILRLKNKPTLNDKATLKSIM